VFNVADVCLVCGASMLVLEAMFAQPKSQPTDGAEYADAQAPAAPIAGGAPASKSVAVTTAAE
jgi:hypothetical protein